MKISGTLKGLQELKTLKTLGRARARCMPPLRKPTNLNKKSSG
ncbi:MAG: hypothetical protein NTV22_11550 [bacterium]|nr:hypothetical protein [bacterium]